jgi:hypothetical protein
VTSHTFSITYLGTDAEVPGQKREVMIKFEGEERFWACPPGAVQVLQTIS